MVISFLVVGLISLSLLSALKSNFFEKMVYGNESYNSLTLSESGDSSLG